MSKTPETPDDATGFVSLSTILEQRKSQHGEFRDHARITQNLKAMMLDPSGESNWNKLSAIQREALEMIVHKIGRILAGNPDHQDHQDHWDDIAGYAKLVSDRIGKK